jgi:hypothetical protein
MNGIRAPHFTLTYKNPEFEPNDGQYAKLEQHSKAIGILNDNKQQEIMIRLIVCIQFLIVF